MDVSNLKDEYENDKSRSDTNRLKVKEFILEK